MLIMLNFIILLNMILMTLALIIPLISIYTKTDREKNSPFECGFDPFSNPRLSFSIHFFSISLMFLIFDIEITLILPIPIMKKFINLNNWFMITLTLIVILIVGLLLEWKEGSMEWK